MRGHEGIEGGGGLRGHAGIEEERLERGDGREKLLFDIIPVL